MTTESIDIIWEIFGIITVALLIIYWRKRNAVWGGFAIGVIVGLIVSIFYLFQGSGFDWLVISKGAILGAMIGFVAELLGMVSDFIKKNNPKS